MLIFLIGFPAKAQNNCQVSDPNIKMGISQVGKIDWAKYPDFTLPFSIIYSGPRFNDFQRLPLKKGFTHLNTFSGDDYTKLPLKNRALLWYSVANLLPNSNWTDIESPWGNDLPEIKRRWQADIKGYTGFFEDSQNVNFPKVDIWVPDIEKLKATDLGILSLKANPRTPMAYRNLSDVNFLKQYKNDMQRLYIEAINFSRNLDVSQNAKISSYSDVPIRTNFLNIDANTWQDWSSNPNRLAYINRDTINTNKVGGFESKLDFLTPSAYFYYDINHPFGPLYLSQLLFQIEANRAWSNKDVIVFEWMRYHPCCGPYPKQIETYMAEAGAIFPFFSGAKGIWLWEEGAYLNPTKEILTSYDAFIYGLYRLSKYKSYFEGNYKLYIPKSGRDHYADKDAIWRGVVKDGKILIAATNPFQDLGKKSTIILNYGNWKQSIELSGKDVFLCEFDLPTTQIPFAQCSVFPNPSSDKIFVNIKPTQKTDINIQLFDMLGNQLFNQNNLQISEDFITQIDLDNLSCGLYVVKISDLQSGYSQTKKIVYSKK